jgi:cytochrome c5
MLRAPIALVITAMALAACQGGSPTGTPSSPSTAAAGTRTYSTAIKPITASQSCRTCHAATQAGSSYEFDKSKAATIVRMAQSNGPKAGLSAQQIADVKAWFDAGSPDDSKTF